MKFDRFAQKVTNQVVQPWFFWLMVLAIVAWIPTLWLWETGPSDLLVDSITNPMSLLLLILLQNSQTRQESAQDSRQDQVEHALALLLRQAADEQEKEDRRRSLREAADALVRNAEESQSQVEGGGSRTS